MRVLPEAKSTCQRTFGAAPDVTVEGDESSTCSYIPTHLEYILFENVKNAMRAVVERNSSRSRFGSTLGRFQLRECSCVNVCIYIYVWYVCMYVCMHLCMYL